MVTTWIVSANASRARFFAQTRPADRLAEVNDMVNTAARLRTAETETDSIGQRAASKSIHSVGAPTQPSGYEPNQTPAEHQTELFARTVAAFLLRSHQEGRFKELVLIASPEFLGMLRKQLHPTLVSAMKLELNKDYTQFNADELREQVHAHRMKV